MLGHWHRSGPRLRSILSSLAALFFMLQIVMVLCPVNVRAEMTSVGAGASSAGTELCACYGNPSSDTLSRCYPVTIDIVWDITEKHTPFPDEPEYSEPVDLKWLIQNHLEGELQVFSKPGCRKLQKKCVEYFILAAPGMNMAGIKNFAADIRNGAIKIVYRDDYGKPWIFKADTSSFFLASDSTELGALNFDLYPLDKKSQGYIDAPKFGWVENGKREIWSKIGAFRVHFCNTGSTPTNQTDTTSLTSKFLPDFDAVISLIKGKDFEQSAPIDYVTHRSFGKTDKRIIKGQISYRIALRTHIPGKLAVSPESGFEATRSSEKEQYRPRVKHYILTNTGKMPISFKVEQNVKWLKIQNTTGQLEPHQSARVTIALTPEADKLKGEKHTGLITFINTTNHTGDTSRKVILKCQEEQTWLVKLTGEQTDDLGGSMMYTKIAGDWKTVTVDYGVRFNWRLTCEFTIKKKKGKWIYKGGKVKSATVTAVPVFDVDVFRVANFRCLNCSDANKLAGYKMDGHVDAGGTSVKLSWPYFNPKVILDWKYKLKIIKNGKIKNAEYARNYFFHSSDFLDIASTHTLVLKNGHLPPKKVARTSCKDAYRLLNKKPISLYYQYYLKRVR